MMKFIKDDVRFGTKPYKFDNSVKKTKLTEEQLERLRAGESLDDILNDDQKWEVEEPTKCEIHLWKRNLNNESKENEKKKEKEKKEEQKVEKEQQKANKKETLTKEKYIELKKKGVIDKNIMQLYGLNVMSLNKFKKENDLIGKFVLSPSTKAQQEKNKKEKENNKTAESKKKTKCEGDRTDCKCDKQEDIVNHPSHYTAGKIECIDALEAATVGLEGIEAVCTANVIKYLWRWKKKNGVEDLEKARWYMDRLIERVK